MEIFKWMVGGLIGAAIGGAIWVAVGYFANYEVGWIAWGIGLLAGLGVRKAAGKKEGAAPGIIALGTAVVAVLLAKYLVVSLIVDRALADAKVAAAEVGADVGIVSLADEICEEYEAQGKEVEWPSEEVLDNDIPEDDYPAEIWEQAQQRWAALSPEEQQARLEVERRAGEEFFQQFNDQVKDQIFKGSFSPWDLLWFGLAAWTAFRVGSGAAREEHAAA